MLYPPKKRAYSPEPNKTKDLANLPNINSKFTGTGGSIFHFIQTHLRLPRENKCQCPNQLSLEFLELRSICFLIQKIAQRGHSFP
jgi:hypothetical protein